MLQRRFAVLPFMSVAVLALSLFHEVDWPGAQPTPQQLTPLPDLREYDWTRWLVGVWEGYLEDAEGNRTALQQSFEYAAGGRHILTQLRVGEAENPGYFGVGIFSYDPVGGLSSGEWFGMLGDRNSGLGRRDGERWVWDIDRHPRSRVLRVRERVSADEYRMSNTTFQPDGSARVTREVMRRVKAGAGAGSAAQ